MHTPYCVIPVCARAAPTPPFTSTISSNIADISESWRLGVCDVLLILGIIQAVLSVSRLTGFLVERSPIWLGDSGAVSVAKRNTQVCFRISTVAKIVSVTCCECRWKPHRMYPFFRALCCACER